MDVTRHGSPMSNSLAGDNMYEIMVKATDEHRPGRHEDVMVEVTNVDEAGTVTLSARRPQAAIPFSRADQTPTAARPRSPTKWQWAKAGSKNGAYTDIDRRHIGCTRRRTPTRRLLPAGHGHLHRPAGRGQVRHDEVESPVQRVRGANKAPEFAAVQDPDGEDGPLRPCAKRGGGEQPGGQDHRLPGDGYGRGRRHADLHPDGNADGTTVRGLCLVLHRLGHGPDHDQGAGAWTSGA